MNQKNLSEKALELKRRAASSSSSLQFVNEFKAADILDFPVGTLRNWRWRGTGPPFHKFGAAVRYELGELADYAKATRRTSTSKVA
jgi:hypothetical protein